MTDHQPALAPDVLDEVERLTKSLADELVALRRDLHAHPELGGAELRTTQVLVARLEAAGLSPRVLPAGTGVVCDIGSDADSTDHTRPAPRTVALRADIDALPIVDEKDVPYRSTVAGVCHACGHDVHATAALGAACASCSMTKEPPSAE